jgi:hypothetical protein
LSFLPAADLSSFRVVIVELHRNIFGREGMKTCRAALSAAGLKQDPDYCNRWVDTWVRP